MNRIGIGILALIVLGVLFVAITAGQKKYFAMSSFAADFCANLHQQYDVLGIPPPEDMNDFYKSSFGSRFKVFRGQVKIFGGTAKGIRLNFSENNKEYVTTFTANLVTQDENGKVHRTSYKYCNRWGKDAVKQTHRLLSSVISGSSLWINEYPGGKVIGNTFPKTLSASCPRINFKVPTIKSELLVYKNWLEQLVGKKRLRDGWGNQIIIELVDSPGHPVLQASSPGPDGKWKTADDIMEKRKI